MDSPNFKTGKYSKYLPEKLYVAYKEALDDPGLLSLRDEIGVLQSFIKEAMKKLDTGETGHLWKKLKEQTTELQSSQKTGDVMGIAQAINNIIALVDKGYSEVMARLEVRSTIQDLRKLTESERDALLKAKQLVPIEQVLVLMTQLVSVVIENVTDPAVIQLIRSEFIRITGVKNSELIDAPVG